MSNGVAENRVLRLVKAIIKKTPLYKSGRLNRWRFQLRERIRTNWIYQKRVNGLHKDVFARESSEHALLVYFTGPFRGENVRMSNRRQAYVLAEVLDELGFSVDVVHFVYRGSLDFSKYTLVLGLGSPFEKSLYANPEAIHIFYATAAHSCQRNHAEYIRLKNLYSRRGSLLPAKRIKGYPDNMSSILSDAILLTGNNWTESTYRSVGYQGSIHRLPVSISEFLPPSKVDRVWDTARSNFLWIGTYAMVLKGVDLLIEAFSGNPDLNLHLVGPLLSPRERDFYDLYDKELTQCPNITVYGRLDVRSSTFRQVASQCGFVISASSSEGQSGGVLTGMSTGMIPIVTRETGIDCDDFGIPIEGLSVRAIDETVRWVSGLPLENLQQRSMKAYQQIKTRHSTEAFRRKARDAIVETIEGRQC